MRRAKNWRMAAALPAMLAIGCAKPAESEPEPDLSLPTGVPFPVPRTAQGEAPTAEETAAFTEKYTGLLAQIEYFSWVRRHSHGLDASYNPTMPSYALWWQDTTAVKEGDTVTYVHFGGADNLMIRTSKVLTNTIAGYLATHDPTMRQLLIDYCNGTVALFKGLSYPTENPVEPYVTARAIFTHNHEYDLDGRHIAVDYDPVKAEQYDWNAHTVPNPGNPTFGSIWVRNMRSKDDLPHMFRVTPWLMRVVQDDTDPEVLAAASQALDYLTGFARDIVEHGYQIRTKENGATYVPEGDLASFVGYDSILPNAECNPKLTFDLLAYPDRPTSQCGRGISQIYEDVATAGHHFNYAIIRNFHLTAILHALLKRRADIAEPLFSGLVERVENMMNDDVSRADHPDWDSDAAAYLLAAAASGLPLTAREARLIQEQYAAAVDHYQSWPLWDLWDPSVADGSYEYIPSRESGGVYYVDPEELSYLLEYCASPWKNPAGVELADCGLILDPSRWAAP